MSIYVKLLEAKKGFGKLVKNTTNPFFKSKYSDLNALLGVVEPELEKHGLLLLQPVLEGHVVTMIVDVETKETIESRIEIGTHHDPQKLGSAITYYRRYSLQSLLSLQAEDDDGNGASKSKPNPTLDDVTFSKLFNAVATKQKDKKGVEIDKEYVTTRYSLTKNQINELNEIPN